MTFKEKLAKEHPECLTDNTVSGCMGCPSSYGYAPDDDCSAPSCASCWSREIPITPEEQEAHDLEINAEIIRGYCDRFACALCDECPAEDVCRNGLGRWSAGFSSASAAEQRAILDAFELALPPEEEEAPTAPQEIPQAVRKLVEGRIKDLTERVKALEAERDALRDWLNWVKDHGA